MDLVSSKEVTLCRQSRKGSKQDKIIFTKFSCHLLGKKGLIYIDDSLAWSYFMDYSTKQFMT